MTDMWSAIFSLFIAGLALAAGFVGLSFVRLPRGGENEFMRAIGAGILFMCFMAALGFVLFRSHVFVHPRQAPEVAGSPHR